MDLLRAVLMTVSQPETAFLNVVLWQSIQPGISIFSAPMAGADSRTSARAAAKCSCAMATRDLSKFCNLVDRLCAIVRVQAFPFVGLFDVRDLDVGNCPRVGRRVRRVCNHAYCTSAARRLGAKLENLLAVDIDGDHLPFQSQPDLVWSIPCFNVSAAVQPMGSDAH